MSQRIGESIQKLEKRFIKFMQPLGYAHWFTGAWIILGLEYFVFQKLYGGKYISIGEVGAYLSGIFAPVAWYWFYLSFKIQTSALEQQTQASNVQFKLAEKNTQRADDQFELYLEDRRNSKPLFRLNDLNEVQFLYSPERGEIPLYFQCRFVINNIGAEAKINMIEVLHPLKGQLIEPSLPSKYWMMTSKLEDTIEVSSNFPIENSARLTTGEFDNSHYEMTSIDYLYLPKQRLARKMCQEYLLQCQFIIYYASASGSGSDQYEFTLANDELIMVKLYRQSVRLRWEA